MQFRIPAIQLTLDDAQAQRAKADAMQRVEEHADDPWKRAALESVRTVAHALREFTTDEVLQDLVAKPVATHEGRALGPVMVHAAKLGWIRNTRQFRNSASVSRHRAPKTVWRSLIYRED